MATELRNLPSVISRFSLLPNFMGPWITSKREIEAREWIQKYEREISYFTADDAMKPHKYEIDIFLALEGLVNADERKNRSGYCL